MPPLSAAERSKNYREKLKRERPEEYENQRIKNLKRINSKKKKVTEMTKAELEKQREKWRQDKKNSRAAKKNNVSVTDSNNISDGVNSITVKKFKGKCRCLSFKLRQCESDVIKMKAIVERYKKRFIRFKAEKEKEIEDLKIKVLKMRTREEILESTLKKTYKEVKSRKDKIVLKKLVKHSANKSLMSNMLGLSGRLRINKKKLKRTGITEIIKFYTRDDVSRITAGKKQCKTKNKNKAQIRYLLDTLQNLYKKYRNEGGRYGFTTFFKSKPFYVISPTVNSRETCLCVKHSNIDLKHRVLKKHGLVNGSVTELLSTIACDITNYLCMHNICYDCNYRNIPFNEVTEEDINREVEWYEWNRVDHKYSKKENNNTYKEVTTKKTAKVKHTGKLEDLKNNFNNSLQSFKKHYFNMIHQQQQYQRVVSNLNENEALIVCDFSENYEAKLSSEIQSMHFGSSKSQITLHTGMIFWKDRTQSFCTIAKNNSHQPPAIWAHLDPIINIIQQESPEVKILHFYSDGPSSQYRQKNNFYLINYLTKTYGFDYATWSFFESGHGKNVADGIGGSVKRVLDRRVSYGADIVNAVDAYDILKQCLKTIKVFLIQDYEIDKIQKLLPTKLTVLKGTMQLHQVITSLTDSTQLLYRNISCFCGDLKGQCLCFSPQIHLVINPENLNQEVNPDNVTNIVNPVPSTSQAIFDCILSSDCQNNLLSTLTATESNIELSDIVEMCEKRILPDINKENEDTPTQSLSIYKDGTIDTESKEIDVVNPALVDISSKPRLEMVPKNKSTFVFTNSNKFKLLTSTTTGSNTTKRYKLVNNTKRKLIGVLTKNEKTSTNFTVKYPECQKCSCSILDKPAKCMACKKLYCLDCTNTPVFFDYICDTCLLGGDSD